MLESIRQKIATWISPNKRVEVTENWQASSKERLGDYSDEPFDHYAQYYVTVDGEQSHIAFDVYVVDQEYRPEARLNLHHITEEFQMYDETEQLKPVCVKAPDSMN